MIDPATALTADGVLRAGAGVAGSTINGALQRPKFTLIKLGSRDERRDVYARYLMHFTLIHHELTDIRQKGLDRGDDGSESPPRSHDIYERLSPHVLQSELAFHELAMVASDPVFATARVLRTYLIAVAIPALWTSPSDPEGHASGNPEQRHQAGDGFGQLRNAFIAVCRKDLWYTPQWWQFHRHLSRWCTRKWKAIRKIGELPDRVEAELATGALKDLNARDKIFSAFDD
ncbi:hypothetical protein [Streptomyces sp. NPDC004728]|uniref:hypothetical protein n=1 Tax=Streptomyces sp. NPDC004728 TaxID=3154289 RepID=UPI0033A559DD